MLSDGKQAGVEPQEWCVKYGFSCMEMFGK